MPHQNPVPKPLNIPLVTQHIDSHTSTEEKYKDYLQKTQINMKQIREALQEVIQSMNSPLSLFSQASTFWAKIPLWQKIGVGIVLIAPLFIIGIMAHLMVLLTLSITALFVYAASSMLLDNHQQYSQKNNERANQLLSNLIGIFDDTLFMLHGLSEQLSVHIDYFRKENTQLSERVSELHRQINTLQEHNESLAQTQTQLSDAKSRLLQTIEALNASLLEQSQRLDTIQTALLQTTQAHDEAQQALVEKTMALGVIKEEMGAEVKKAHAVISYLKGVIQPLSAQLIQNNVQKAAFLKKLEDVLNAKEQSLNSITEQLGTSTRQVVLDTIELERANQRYQSLLSRQEQQVTQLEAITIESQRTEEIEPVSEKKVNSHVFFSQSNTELQRPIRAICILTQHIP